MRIRFFLLALLLPAFPVTAPSLHGEDDVLRRARELNRRLLIADTHVDTPYHSLEHDGWRFDERHDDGHVDLPRLVESGLDVPFMVVYTPSELEPPETALHAFRVLDLVHGWAASHPERLVLAGSPAEVIRAKEAGKIAMVLCMENGSPVLPGRLDLLRTYHRLGVRYLSLAHWRSNFLCDSATDEPIHGGVSDFGKEVIAESNRLGIMLDVSHVSDDAVRDYLAYSRAPIIASHSNARARCGHPRNLPDDLLVEIARRGGVIQLNLAAQYVSESYRLLDREHRSRRKEKEDEIARRFEGDEERARAEIEKLREDAAKLPPPPLDEWFAHVAHVVDLVGVDHVGLGSDFDGVRVIPAGIKDVTSLALLTEGFLERGWKEEDLEKFYGGNLLRVWRKVEELAGNR